MFRKVFFQNILLGSDMHHKEFTILFPEFPTQLRIDLSLLGFIIVFA